MRKMMKVTGVFMLVFLTLACHKSIAQEQADGHWTTYTTSNGLPYNEVAAIAFGPDGDLWCVLVHPGGGGIAHFDGNTWEHYTIDDGLGSDVILWTEHTLAMTADGELWVATFGGGVSRFDGEAWTSYTTADGLLTDQLTAVAIAPDGELWCTHPGPDGGISSFDGESWNVYTPNDMGISECHLINIAFAPDSALWVSGGEVLRSQHDSWTDFSTQTGMDMSLYMDIGADGRIWIGSVDEGVTCFEDNAWTHYSLADMGAKGRGELMPLAVDAENVLWVGVSVENDENNEVFKFDGTSWMKFTPEGGPSLRGVYTITVGPDGTIWFGTDYGLFGYNEKATVIKVPNTQEDPLAVYPNPFNDEIMIKGNRDTEACISVYNVTGNILIEENCKGKKEIRINTAHLPKGIYLVEVASGEKSIAHKMIKMNGY